MINSDSRIKRVYRPDKRICKYCGRSRYETDLTRAPEKPELLSKWVEILGPVFAENVQKFKVVPICLDHFENRERIPGVSLPIVSIVNDDNIIEKQREKFQQTDENEKDPLSILPPKSAYMKFTCRYCEKICLAKNMTTVPTKEELLKKWVEILGARFLENLRRNRTDWICWSHFKNRDAIKRRFDNFPMKDEQIEAQISKARATKVVVKKRFDIEWLLMSKVDQNANRIATQSEKLDSRMAGLKNFNNIKEVNGNHYCRVCGIRNNVNAMSPVPTNPKILQKWMDILGAEFSQNIYRSFSPNFICLEHLKDMLSKL